MRKIKLRFTDFWVDLNYVESVFYKLLSNRYDIELSDNPDYIIYSVFGYDYLKYDCIRIFYTGEQVCPDFDIADYAIGFETMIFDDRYIRFPLFALSYSPEKLTSIESDFQEINIDNFVKRDFAVFTYSNSKATSSRDQFYQKLNQVKQVTSPGKHLNNTGFFISDKVAFENKFKFSIAFENASYRGYLTEKILDSFAANTIPIYYGDEIIENDFHPESFINLHNFNNFDEAIEYILTIENDSERLQKMLKHIKFKDHVYLYQEQLIDFFDNIFNQDLSQAIRRPDSNRTRIKVKRLKLLGLITSIKRRRIYRFLVKITKQTLYLKNRLSRKLRGN